MDVVKSEVTASGPSIQELRGIVTDYYGDEVWKAVKAGLAVVCSLAVKGRPMPLTLIYEGPSGTGKSTCINMLTPDRDATRGVLYRLDSFTPKAFVTHAANVPADQLKEIDLLPKLKNKVMLTKELAPMFRGNETELRERFAMLAAILDGKGYQSASGVHGTRGYTEEIIFNWIGGTTPIPAKTDDIMAQLGNRMLRYEFQGTQYTAEDIAAYLDDQSQDAHERECRTMANAFAEAFFRDSPIESITDNRCGTFLWNSRLRTEARLLARS